MRAGPTATQEIVDDDRVLAVEIAQRLGVASAPLPSVERVARLLAELRAGAYAAGLEAARRPFEVLFGSNPDTTCRTTYRESAAAPECSAASIECVEVPIDELRDAFGDSL